MNIINTSECKIKDLSFNISFFVQVLVYDVYHTRLTSRGARFVPMGVTMIFLSNVIAKVPNILLPLFSM
jgi:hypothetical protein